MDSLLLCFSINISSVRLYVLEQEQECSKLAEEGHSDCIRYVLKNNKKTEQS